MYTTFTNSVRKVSLLEYSTGRRNDKDKINMRLNFTAVNYYLTPWHV